jgi:hypothetical protein
MGNAKKCRTFDFIVDCSFLRNMDTLRDMDFPDFDEEKAYRITLLMIVSGLLVPYM